MSEVDIVRVGDGGVRIAAVPGPVGPAFARAVLEVAGAVLVWPVVDDPGLPSADIHDPASAQQWLWALYGERAASAVHACAAGESDGLRVMADATGLAASAGRLALGHWASRWWPTSYLDGIPALQPDVLGLESAALTHRCQQLFAAEGDEFDDRAAELIEDHQAALDGLVEWWRSVPASAEQGNTARSLERVLRLVDAAADSAGLDGAALRRLRTALDRGRPTTAAPVPAGLAGLFARPGGYALAAGDALPAAGGRVIARGLGSNDWCRYPPGLVDAAESAVSWTARAVGARRQVEVEVVATDTASEMAVGTQLAAEIRVDGGVPNRIRLGRRDDVWTGAADLERSDAESLARVEVGVLLPGFDPGGGDGADRTGGRDAREAVRSLARRRLGATAGRFLAEIAAAESPAAEDF